MGSGADSDLDLNKLVPISLCGVMEACLVCFVAACILERNVMHVFDEYVADQVYQHHDWHESGLWEFLNSTRKDPQTCHLLKPICGVLETMGVEVSQCKLQECRQPSHEGDMSKRSRCHHVASREVCSQERRDL